MTEFLASGNASLFTASVSEGQAFWLPPCFLSCSLASSSPLLGIKCHAFTAAGLAHMKAISNDPFVQNSDAKVREELANLVKELCVCVWGVYSVGDFVSAVLFCAALCVLTLVCCLFLCVCVCVCVFVGFVLFVCWYACLIVCVLHGRLFSRFVRC